MSHTAWSVWLSNYWAQLQAVQKWRNLWCSAIWGTRSCWPNKPCIIWRFQIAHNLRHFWRNDVGIFMQATNQQSDRPATNVTIAPPTGRMAEIQPFAKLMWTLIIIIIINSFFFNEKNPANNVWQKKRNHENTVREQSCELKLVMMSRKKLNIVTRTNARLGDKSFAVAGPIIWTSLPTSLRQPDTKFG